VPHKKKRTIGWRERVAFPDWKIAGIQAKIDTGARTSALHVDEVSELPGDRIRFNVVLNRKQPAKKVTVEAKVVRTTRVRSSSGHQQKRYVVEAKIKIGPVTKVIETSLVSRANMTCRMLIGRKALEGDFLVDASKRYVFGGPPKNKAKVKS
jgi:hypothetical protein